MIKIFINNHKKLVSIVFLILIVCVFFYKSILFGLLPVPTDSLVGLYHPWRDYFSNQYPRGYPFKNPLITDSIRQQIPWRKYTVDLIKNGIFPSWNSTAFSGTPLLANIQAGVFYPLNILFFIFDFKIAWSILIILQPLLAGIFMYLYLKNLNLSYRSVIFGSILFMFCGFSISWMTWGTIVQTILWMPLELYAIDKLFVQSSTRKQFGWALIFIVAQCSHVFAGHLQIAFYVCAVTFGYFIYRLKYYRSNNQNRNLVFIFCASIVIVGLITFIQWKPLYNLLQESGRYEDIQWTKEGWFLPWPNLIQFFIPDYFGNPATLNYWGTWNYGEFIGYIGLPGVFAFIIHFLSNQFKKTSYWLLVSLASLLCMTQNPLSELIYRFHIPVLSLLQPTRLMGVFDFSIIIFAVYGFESFRTLNRNNVTKAIGIFCLVVIVPAFFAFSSKFFISNNLLLSNLQISLHNSIYPIFILTVVIVLISLLLKYRSNIKFYNAITALFIFILIVDLFRFGWKFTPFTNTGLFYPESNIIQYLTTQPKTNRIMVLDDRIFAPNTLTYYGLESVSGYDPLYKSRYAEFTAALQRNQPNIQEPFGFNRIISPTNINSPLFSILNPYYVVSYGSIQDSRFSFIMSEGNTFLYKNKNVLPRLYFVSQIIPSHSKQEVINTLYKQDYNYIQTAIIDGDVPDVSIKPTSQKDLIELISYNANSLTARVNSDGAHFIVIQNIYDAGWRIEVDNKLVKPYITNYQYLGIFVPSGTHIVHIYYTIKYL